jgi:hypothetical protein
MYIWPPKYRPKTEIINLLDRKFNQVAASIILAFTKTTNYQILSTT